MEGDANEVTVTAAIPVSSPPVSSGMLSTTILPLPPPQLELSDSSWSACTPPVDSPVVSDAGTASEPWLQLGATTCDSGLGGETSSSELRSLCSSYEVTSPDSKSEEVSSSGYLPRCGDSELDHSSDYTISSTDGEYGGYFTRRRRGKELLKRITFEVMEMSRHETLQDYATRLEEAFRQKYPGRAAGSSERLRDRFLVSYHHKFESDMANIMNMKSVRHKFDWRTIVKCIDAYYT
jgi:hypothetical protein